MYKKHYVTIGRMYKIEYTHKALKELLKLPAHIQKQITNSPTHQSLSSAFTLIEISIVLVIIGLVVGGIMVGQSLIRSAQLNKVAKDVEMYVTAVNTFKLKYNCLIGDCGNATDFFSGTANGNNNAQINYGGTSVDGYLEQFFAWEHLSLANLINGKYFGTSEPPKWWTVFHTYQAGYNVPPTGLTETSFYKIRYLGTVKDGDFELFYFRKGYYGHIMYVSEVCPSSFGWCDMGPFSAREASMLDAKFDDGLPFTGRILSEANCADAPTYAIYNAYFTTTSPINCAVVFRTGF